MYTSCSKCIFLNQSESRNLKLTNRNHCRIHANRPDSRQEFKASLFYSLYFLNSEAYPGCFHQGQIPFQGKGRNIIIIYRSRLKCEKLFSAPPPQVLFLPPGHNTEERVANYLIITKDRLVLASAPYSPIKAFFIRGRNLFFQN